MGEYLLASFGTDGDVIPHLELGRCLRERGHRAVLLSNPAYQGRAREWGLEFEKLIEDEQVHGILADPDFWHPLKGGLVASKWGAPLIPGQYDVLKGLCSCGTVIVASPGVLAARMLQEKRGVHMATLLLQPGLIPSIDLPPQMPGIGYPEWGPRFIGRMYWRMVNFAGHMLIASRFQAFRDTLDLPPVERLFDWWWSTELVLGMFPAWYGPPQADWPRQLRLAGFGLSDGGGEGVLSPELMEFLGQGEAPVAFTFGTGMMHSRRLFALAAEACERLGRRGLLLTRFGRQLPQRLPPEVMHVEYAPFSRLFPRCAAVVHHGGIGTTAQALASGRRQLVLPLAFDQPDNGKRVERLGAGRSISPHRLSAGRLADGLREVLSKPYSFTYRAENGLENAAAILEQLYETKPTTAADPPKPAAMQMLR